MASYDDVMMMMATVAMTDLAEVREAEAAAAEHDHLDEHACRAFGRRDGGPIASG